MKSLEDFAVADVTLAIDEFQGTFTAQTGHTSQQTQIGDWELSAADVAVVLATVPNVERHGERWWVLAPHDPTLHLLDSYPFEDATFLVRLRLGLDEGTVNAPIDAPATTLTSEGWTPEGYETEIEEIGYTITSLWVVRPEVDFASGRRELVCEALVSPLNPQEWVPTWS